MKKLIAALMLLPSLCLAAGGDLVLMQRLPDDSSSINRLVTKPAGTNDGVLGYLGSTQRPYFLQLGQGLQLNAGVLSANSSGQANADWSAVSGPALILNKPSLFSGAYADLSGKPALFSGAYADLTGKPALFSGSYVDLTNKPALFSGAYSDLTGVPINFSPAPHTHAAADIVSGTLALARLPSFPISQTAGLQGALDGKYPNPAGNASQYLRGDGSLATFPSIPAAQVNSDWNAITGAAQILNKPTLAPVATAGTFASLTSKPNTISGYGLTDAASLTQLAGKFNTPTGTTSQYVRGDGTLATLPTARRIETYTGTTNASGQIIVTYPTAFTAVPNVQTPPPALANQVWTLTSSTAAGFTAVLSQRNVTTLLGLEVLLGATVPVANSAAQIVVIER